MNTTRNLQRVVMLVLFGLALCRPTSEVQAQTNAAEQQPVPMSESSSQLAKMAIHVVSSKTGEPLEGVELAFVGRIGIRTANRTLKTGADGRVDLNYSGSATIPNLRFTTKKAGFVPVHYSWNSEQSPASLPKELELTLDPGVKIGGIVQDADGKPIVGVALRLYMPVTWPPQDGYVFSLSNLVTDREGRWEYDSAPTDTSRLNVSMSHPEYLSSSNRATAGMENNTVLQQGPIVAGRVVDPDGKPASFARVLIGRDRFGSDEAQTVTDAEGQFTLRNCRPGDSAITVLSDKFAPSITKFVVAAKNSPVSITLELPHIVRGRVVDTSGKPIPGTTVVPDTWRGNRTIDVRMTTDPEGRFEWRSAPGDVVEYDILHQGYMALRNHRLIASDDELVITMNPELVISGKVTDAATGEPMKNFRMRRGQADSNQSRVSYWYEEVATYNDGTYTYRLDEPNRWVLQADADGYLPLDSRQFAASEGKVTFDFALKRGSGPEGIVLLPSGEPAVGAEIGIISPGNSPSIRMARFESRRGVTPEKTDDQGRFKLRPMSNDLPFIVVVLHDQGFVKVTSKEFAKQNKLTLTAWGRIEGRAMVGSKPDVNRSINYNVKEETRDPAYQDMYFNFNYSAATDADGRFTFERVVPGPGNVARYVNISFGNYGISMPDGSQEVDVRGGETVQVKLGGAGRPVTGHVKTDREPDAPLNWSTNSFARVVSKAEDEKNPGASRYSANHVGRYDGEGKFTVNDVPAGDYTLYVSVTSGPSAFNSPEIGNAQVKFTVPEVPGGQSDEPLNLGEITAKLLPVLNQGDPAPEFALRSAKGEILRMSDLSGKLVYINFLPNGSESGSFDMGALKRIHDQFGKDPNFVMLTVWCGESGFRTGSTITQGTLAWKEATVDGLYAAAPQSFMVRALPTSYLVGANGRIISRNAKEADVKNSIDSLLSLGDLYFATEKGERPPRFNVKRFELPADAAKLTVAPAVVVLEDSDQTYEPDKPHNDVLRMLAADGSELWSIDGWNVSGGRVIVDRQRERIYVGEDLGHRLTAVTLEGQKVWQVDNIGASDLLLDEKTGNIWASSTSSVREGQIVVLDPEGRDVTSFPYAAFGMAYDPRDDSFWLVSAEILKINRQGEVLFQKPVENAYCSSVALNRADGSVWVVERSNASGEAAVSRVWLLAADGAVKQENKLVGINPAVAAYAPKQDVTWVACLTAGLRRVTPDGKLSEPFETKARSVAVSETTGDIWCSTEEALVKLDASGREVLQKPLKTKTYNVWMAAF